MRRTKTAAPIALPEKAARKGGGRHAPASTTAPDGSGGEESGVLPLPSLSMWHLSARSRVRANAAAGGGGGGARGAAGAHGALPHTAPAVRSSGVDSARGASSGTKRGVPEPEEEPSGDKVRDDARRHPECRSWPACRTQRRRVAATSGMVVPLNILRQEFIASREAALT